MVESFGIFVVCGMRCRSSESTDVQFGLPRNEKSGRKKRLLSRFGTTARDVFFWRNLVLIISACLLSGCTWRTLQADYLLGPVRYRFSEPSTEKAAVFQSVHFPVLIEGGSQWGVSIGGIHRLALSSARFDSVDPADDVHATPRGWLIHPQPRRWQWSWIYLRAPLRGRPEFIRRSMVGVQGGAGGEERAISLV